MSIEKSHHISDFAWEKFNTKESRIFLKNSLIQIFQFVDTKMFDYIFVIDDKKSEKPIFMIHKDIDPDGYNKQ